MKYKVIKTDNIESLEQLVDNAFEEGWRPIGGMCAVAVAEPYHPSLTSNGEPVGGDLLSIFCQSLIFVDPEPEPERTKEQMVQQAMKDMIASDPEMRHQDPKVN